jgi:hypothetical protein
MYYTRLINYFDDIEYYNGILPRFIDAKIQKDYNNENTEKKKD